MYQNVEHGYWRIDNVEHGYWRIDNVEHGYWRIDNVEIVRYKIYESVNWAYPKILTVNI